MRPEPSTGGPAASRTPRRILVANTAHLGDLVLATSVLPALKSAHPEAEIGFLCGGWNQPLAEGHPLVASVHSIDHWLQNRGGESLVRKLVRYLRIRSGRSRTSVQPAILEMSISSADVQHNIRSSYRRRPAES